ncbi:HNH endonuclease [Rhodococcus jostii]|uniref:HNH endonuclease n=1 Tax=Rhodococcus jostii TaxID=132919 RepID=UPI00363B0703
MSKAWAGGSTRAWRTQRTRALRRDNYRCVLCGEPANEVNHRVGKADGGGDDLGNLETLCTPHHAEITAEQTRQAAVTRSPARRREAHPGLY